MATHSSILAWRIPMDRGAWWVTVYRVAKSRTRLKQLNLPLLQGKVRKYGGSVLNFAKGWSSC